MTRVIARRVLDAAASQVGLSVDDLTGPSRKLPLVWARARAMLVIRRYRSDLSYKTIGALFGGRDHSTVRHAVAEAQKRLASGTGDASLTQELLDLFGRDAAPALRRAIETTAFRLAWMQQCLAVVERPRA
ncbi:hypothetical protein JIP62_06315 [Brevundimonas vitis]|uniref:Chromosomal replication initiator DnaA C-terminal domain-containing protein n=1 Tax=Brevundimonas vitisensis TaxID=2800818 RepID=A0ABX7BSI5_9CAUL|nr:helix-turn-helix domain-containing protein [Brevundimonas vitisensis]QQQ19698.1 hypothetical protein JIP62_06315 [Brevundimonas vitisensis]